MKAFEDKRKYFFDSWKNKSETEKKAIGAVKKSIKFLFENFPKEKIISVYIKGSFVARDMNENSDVDLVPIVKDQATLNKLKILRDDHRKEIWPVDLLPLSLEDLKNVKGELHSRRNMFLRDLAFHELIYGKEINAKNYQVKSFKEAFEGEIQFTRKFISLYLEGNKEGKYGFSQLVKNVFWLTYSEQKILGKNPPRTWSEMDRFIEDKKHVIHSAFRFRIKSSKNKKLRLAFINRLDKYLNYLENTYVSTYKFVMQWNKTVFDCEWSGDVDFENLPSVNDVHGFVFDDQDRVCIVKWKGDKHWGDLGGRVEKLDKTFEDTFIREVDEEADLDIQDLRRMGYIKYTKKGEKNSSYGVKIVARVKKIKPSTIDPARGEIPQRKFIDPKKIKEYTNGADNWEFQVKKALEILRK
ncbi:MAG: NUDIX domain-containing protein [archaeon]